MSSCTTRTALRSKYDESVAENATAAHTTTTGVRVSIRRTITPAKYTAVTAYSTTNSRSGRRLGGVGKGRGAGGV